MNEICCPGDAKSKCRPESKLLELESFFKTEEEFSSLYLVDEHATGISCLPQIRFW